MLSKLNFSVIPKIVRIVSIVFSLFVLTVFIVSCQGESQKIENEMKSNQESIYLLSDEKIMEALNFGITMDEINFLTFISRKENHPISNLIEQKTNGMSMTEIIKQFKNDEYWENNIEKPREDEKLYSENKSGKDLFIVYSDPRRKKEATNYKISDFRTISYGMTPLQVITILDGRKPNKSIMAGTERNSEIFIDIYELLTGEEVWINYSIKENKAFCTIETMVCRNPENPDQDFNLIRKLDEYNETLDYILF